MALVSPELLAQFSAIVETSFEDTLTLYTFLPDVSNGEGGYTQGFQDPPIENIPCKVDDEVSGRPPETEKDQINIWRVIRTIYIPKNTVIKNDDEVETSGGNPSGAIIRYKVLDITRETGQTDIALLAEEVR